MNISAQDSTKPSPAQKVPVSTGWALLIALVSEAGLLAYRLPHLHDALFSDETMFLIKAAMIKRGGLVYRDLWDHHPPGLEMLLALLPMRLLQAEAAIRLVSVVSLGVTVFFAADMMLRVGIKRWAVFAGAFVFTMFHSLDWFAAFYLMNEQLMVLPLTLMIWILWRRKTPAAAWFFWGLTTLFKQTAIVFLPLLLVMDFYDPERRRACGYKGILLRALAASASWLMVVVYFAAKGGFSDLVRNVVLDALHRRELNAGFYCSAWFNWKLCSDYKVLLICFALLALISLRPLLRPTKVSLVFFTGICWLGSALLYLWIQKCGQRYYYEMATPGLMLLTAWAFDWNAALFHGAATLMKRITHGLLFVLLCIGVLVPIGRFSDNHLPSWLPSTYYSYSVRRLAREMKTRLPKDYLVLAVQDYPGWYWYLDQPPPGVVWIPYFLQAYPERRENLVESVASYGRGKQLLIVYVRDPDSPQTRVSEFRGQLLARGAQPASLAGLLGLNDEVTDGFYADLWDLRGCGSPGFPCAAIAGGPAPLR